MLWVNILAPWIFAPPPEVDEKKTKKLDRRMRRQWPHILFFSNLFIFSGHNFVEDFYPKHRSYDVYVVSLYVSFLLFLCLCIFGCGCFIMTWLQWQNQYAQTVGPCSSICSFCFGAAAGLTTQHRATLCDSNCPEAMRSNQGEADFFRAFDVSRLFTRKLRTNGLLYRNV